jgi:hypothetical protein
MEWREQDSASAPGQIYKLKGVGATLRSGWVSLLTNVELSSCCLGSIHVCKNIINNKAKLDPGSFSRSQKLTFHNNPSRDVQLTMLDPVTGVGLASSIVTFIELAAKVGKRTWDFSQALGDLPPDLQSCKNIIDIVSRTAERLGNQLRIDRSRPSTASEADLELLFKTLTSAADEFGHVLSDLLGARSFVKALKTVFREGKIKKIRDQLDRDIISLLFVLQSGVGRPQDFRFVFDGLLRFSDSHSEVACDLKREFLQFHQDIESRMSSGFSELEREFRSSKDEILDKVEHLLSKQDSVAKYSHRELVLGQEDILASLSQLVRSISDARSERNDEAAQDMTERLTEHKDVTQVLVSLFKGHSQAQSAQIQQLVKSCSNWKICPHILRRVLLNTLSIESQLKVSPKTNIGASTSR